MSVYLFPPLVALFINAILAPAVLFGHLRDRSHQVFALFLTSMAFWGGTIFLMRDSPTLEEAFFWEKGAIINFALISIFYLQYTYNFARANPAKWILPLGYILIGVVVALTFSGLIVQGMQVKFYGYAPIPGAFFPAYLVFAYTCIFLGLWNVVGVYRQPSSQPHRNRAGYLIVGTACSLIGSATDLLPILGLSIYPLGIVGNILFAVLASFAILRHRLMDINVALRRSVGFSVVIIFIAAVYVLALFAMHKTFGTAFLALPIAIGVGLMVLGYATLPPLLGKVQGGIDRLIYGQRWGAWRELRQFATETKDISDLTSLADSLVQLVGRAMATRVVMLLKPELSMDAGWNSVGIGADQTLELPEGRECPLLQSLAGDDRPLLAREVCALPGWQLAPDDTRQRLQEWGIEVYVPLVSRQQLTGLLLLGGKDSGGSYSLEEIDLLQAVALHAATTMDNSRLFEELRQQLEELKETQAQLVQSGKLASVGTLAAGVAHEVNNPIFVITGMAELLLNNPEAHFKSPQASECLEIIDQMSDRIAKVVQGLLVYSRNEQATSLVNLNEVADDTLRLVEHKLRVEGVTVARDYHPDLPPIRAVANKLQQALMNLILNASDAMEKSGGTLTLATGCGEARVWLSCADTGSGISGKNLDRIFDAFFTTKPVGKGTGLGLHITHTIIQDCGGEICVESEPGGGTVFTIYLPTANTDLEESDLYDDEYLLDLEWDDPVAERHSPADISN